MHLGNGNRGTKEVRMPRKVAGDLRVKSITKWT